MFPIIQVTPALFLVLNLHQPFASAEIPVATEALHALAKSMRELQLPVAGRGAAYYSRTISDLPVGNENSYLKFWFQDRCSRTDVYADKGDKKPRSGWFTTPEIIVHFDSKMLQINVAESPSRYSRLGHDYNPGFLMYMGYALPIDRLLTRYAKDPQLTTIRHGRLGESGTIKIVFDYDTPDYADKQELTLVQFESDYLPVVFERHPRIQRRNVDSRSELRIDWKKWNKAIYPQSVRKKATDNIGGQVTEERVDIESFHEERGIKPAIFSVHGFVVPNGVLVIDNVAGISYYKGQARFEIKDLKEPLIESGLLEKYRPKEGLKASPSQGTQKLPEEE